MSPAPIAFQYKGQHSDFFGLYLKNMILTMLTFGIYKFWAKVENTQFLYRHLFLASRSFDYHATGKELFKGFLKGIGILILLGAAFAGLNFFLNAALPPLAAQIVLSLVALPLYLFAIPFVIYGKTKFWLARTSWSQVRFRFDGTYKDILVLYLKTLLFSILTLGLYAPFWFHNLQKYTAEHTSIGQARFGYDGTGKDMFFLYFGGLLLTVLTAGIYFPWFTARLTRYVINHTTLNGNRLQCTLTGWNQCRLMVGNLFLIIFTLGLAIPVAINRNMRVFFPTVAILADESLFQGLVAVADNDASAFAGGLEQAADALDAVSGIF